MKLFVAGIFAACLCSTVLSGNFDEDVKGGNPKEIQEWYSQPKTWFPLFLYMKSLSSNPDQGKPWFLQRWYNSGLKTDGPILFPSKTDKQNQCHRKSDCSYLSNHQTFDCINGQCSFLPLVSITKEQPKEKYVMKACMNDDDCPGGYICHRRECVPILMKPLITKN
uniref:Uncharacterized protein n=1 Tax=Panagrolaimus superbus TaxID=310955 RepID=A0A914Z828_9BILA